MSLECRRQPTAEPALFTTGSPVYFKLIIDSETFGAIGVRLDTLAERHGKLMVCVHPTIAWGEMALFDWLKKKETAAHQQGLEAWRRAWAAALEDPAAADIRGLETSLRALNLAPEETEIEDEMLEGVAELVRLCAAWGAGAPPILETSHKVVGSDTCYFSAPVSRPDDPAQSSGRFFLTSRRAVFAGGERALTMAWHAVGGVLQSERDVMLVRNGRDTVHTFRCNTYRDALCAGYIARQLLARARR
jgi:hypothetical protein